MQWVINMLNIQKFKKHFLTAAGSAAVVLMSAVAVHAASFSVTLPTSLPVTMAANGTVTTSNSVVVRNTGDNKASVSNVSISGANGWTYDGSNVAGTSYASTKVNTNRFVMSASIPNTVMKNGETVTITYSAKMPVRSAAGSNIQIANVVVTVRDEGPDVQPLTFSSASSFTLSTGNSTKNWDGTLYYSTDGSTWSTWDGTTTLSSGSGNKLYLKGAGNTVITGNVATAKWVLTGSDICCNGNIEVLLDYDTVAAGSHPNMGDYCYYQMFNGNSTSLISAPELPATTLSAYCYSNMFTYCHGLTAAPELPATTLANYCYAGMFNACTGLTTAPTLPATTLQPHCYQSMFYGCTGLTAAPELPATTLADSCYYTMFYGCTSITVPCKLPATTLASACYYNMFRRTGIKMSKVRSAEYTIAYRIPSAGTGTTATNALGYIFYETNGIATADPAINTVVYFYDPNVITFRSSSQFTISTANASKNWNGTIYYSLDGYDWSVWDGANTIVSGAENVILFKGSGNTRITGNVAGSNWVVTGTNVSCRGNLESLFDYSTVASGMHPQTASYACYRMFYNCTSLISIPDLCTESLQSYSYYEMFSGCTGIKLSTSITADYTRPFRVPYRGTGTQSSNALTNMFAGTGGTFTGTPALNTTYYEYSPMIAFTSASSFTIGTTNSKRTWRGEIQYSTDGMSWSVWNGTSAISSGSAKTIFMKGTHNDAITRSSGASNPVNPWVITGTAVSCYGNIEGLMCYDAALVGEHIEMYSYCCQQMFYNNTCLVTAPKLTATTLANYAYQEMFRGCTGLTAAPELPATTLANYCYKGMFYGCTALATAPQLPATTLANYCYQQMFFQCTALTQLPNLPATTLTSSCYNQMFYRCTNIKLSETKTGIYQTPYRVPQSGTGTDGTNSMTNMFAYTGGTFTGTPTNNTTYYTSNGLRSMSLNNASNVVAGYEIE